ncbi:non-ribosomal peptide synthetase [Paenibacillus daejeonensis]|uniref:non-ribosomal peptide synthetase n=1 Tax=Paenibacillus daejeonensis TaxID=135193 RepID=UPI000360EDA8|nr:non-ribosomal peptide synthetase [Paenibacillus daejeonensis]
MDKIAIQTIYPMTPLQEGMLFQQAGEGQQTAYIEQRALTLKGEVRAAELEQAINRLVARHDSLRTVFSQKPGKRGMQVVLKGRRWKLAQHDLSTELEPNRDLQLSELLAADLVQGFNPAKDQLIRFALVNMGSGDYRLIITFHHALMDGWCLGPLFGELLELYAALTRGEEPVLPDPVPLEGYLEWLGKRDREAALTYWSGALAGAEQPPGLPGYAPAGEGQPYELRERVFTLPASLSRELGVLARDHGATLSTLIQTMWGVLLQRYQNTDDAVFGTVVSGRPPEVPGIESMMGLFINTVPCRVTSSEEESLGGLLRRMQDEALNAQQYAFSPLYEVQARTGIRIDHLVVFENFPMEQELTGAGNAGAAFAVTGMDSREQTGYPLTVAIYPGEELLFKLSYNAKVYPDYAIQGMERHLRTLLEQAVTHAGEPVKHLQLLSSEEQAALLAFNPQPQAYPDTSTVHSLFAAQTRRTPELPAVAGPDGRLTYGELAAESDRLAGQLRPLLLAQHTGQAEVPDGAVVAILCPPCSLRVVSVLAALQAGAAFLPIDPAYPDERIRYMLRDSGAAVLLGLPEDGERLADLGGSATVQWPLETGTLAAVELARNERQAFGEDGLAGNEWQGTGLDTLATSRRTDGDANMAAVSGQEGNVLDTPEHRRLAYIIYTSGTTGNPKGVLTEHRSLVNFAYWHHRDFGLGPSDRAAQLTGFGFDVSVWETFSALLFGAELHLVPDDVRTDVHALNDFFHTHEITAAFLPAPLCELFLELDNTSLRLLTTGGDKLRVYRETPYRFVNNYGPTEYTIVTTSGELTEHATNLPIGGPVDNTRIYILDRYDRLQPVGATGELCVAGDGLARGYLHLPEETTRRFTPDPLMDGERMYRTGDSAAWLPDGRIVFLGRRDQQVKIRGYRIETGEIESVLLRHPAIHKGAVVAWQDAGTPQLAAYYSSEAAEVPQPTEVREHLSLNLPDYMVPLHIIPLEHLPLTANGKLDRAGLPRPIVTGGEAQPETTTERRLAELWQTALDVQKVGIDDDFFALGGHSLHAMQLAAELRKSSDKEIGPAVLFRLPTIRALAAWLDGVTEDPQVSAKPMEAGDAKVEPVINGFSGTFPPLASAGERDVYPASSAQRRMVVLQQWEKRDTRYNMPQALMLEGGLDAGRLEQSLAALIQRHEPLRTVFDVAEGEVVQRVLTDAWEGLERLSPSADVDPAERMRRWIRPFDLSQGPLLRAALLQIEAERHLLLLDVHHVATDGLSMGLLLADLQALYENGTLPNLKLQYKDYAVWQQASLHHGELQRQLRYWVERLQGAEPLQLPVDRRRPVVQSFAGDSLVLHADAALTSRLQELAASQGCTLYMVLLAAYKTLLYRYGGQSDLTVGTPVSGRTHPETAAMQGLFVNTLALRSFPEGQRSFTDYLAEIRKLTLEGLEHQDVPFEALIETLEVARDASRHPLFDTMFAMQNTGLPEGRLGGVTMRACELPAAAARFDLTLFAEGGEQPGEPLRLELEFATALFDRETAGRMLAHYVRLLHAVAGNPNQALAQLPMLGEEEQQALMMQSRGPEHALPESAQLYPLLAEQAQRTPDAVAIEDATGRSMTYAELHEQAGQWAERLRLADIGRGARVALLAGRSIDTVIAILAVLRSGAAYVPLDPGYPAARLAYMLAHSQPALVLAERTAWRSLASAEPHVYQGLVWAWDEKSGHGHELEVISANLEGADQGSVSSHEGVVETPDDLAYVLYTSGSTGRPKGVMVTQRGLVNYARWAAEAYSDGRPATMPLFTSLSFDLTVTSLFVPLLTGGSIIVCEDEEDTGRLLQHIVASPKVTIMKATPAHLALLERLSELSATSLRRIIVGGEQLYAAPVERLLASWPGELEICNEYGPTEAVVGCTLFRVRAGTPLAGDDAVPIGVPIDNAVLYVLDEAGQPVPPLVQGELYIGGAGVAAGYLGAPELTEQRFVEDPYRPGYHMYRTGDLVRRLPSGDLSYIGRTDDQVKVRGYRIELGEIERALTAHPDIREAVAALRPADGENEGAEHQQVLAWYTSAAEQAIPPAEWRTLVAERLPVYMRPAHLIRVSEMPLTANGKLDKRALPSPERWSSAAAVDAPRTPLESQLSTLWREQLGKDAGREEDFFALGGHSLRAMLLTARIRETLGVELPLSELFRAPTIAAMAAWIERAERTVLEPLPSITEQLHYPVTPAQKRMYLLHSMEGGELAYNMPQALRLEGPLDHERLGAALAKLIDRHSLLRTSFVISKGEIVQQIAPQANVPLMKLDSRTSDNEQEALSTLADWIRPFDLAEAPLLRVGLLPLGETKHLLLIDMHHIIGDAITAQVLLSELAALYEGQSLPVPAVAYANYAVWQTTWLGSEAAERGRAYWRNQLGGELPVLELPTDRRRPAVQTFHGERLSFAVSKELTTRLNELARAHGATLFMTLLAAYKTLLSRYSGQEELAVGTPVAGRTHPQTTEMPGLFVNTLVLRTRPQASRSFTQFLHDVRQTAIEAYEHQDVPFEELVELLDVVRDPSRNPLFDTMFLMQQEEIRTASLGEAELSSIQLPYRVSSFDLTLSADETPQGLRFEWEYNTDLFDATTVQRLADHYMQLLQAVTDAPETQLGQLPIVSADEHRLLTIELAGHRQPSELAIAAPYTAESQPSSSEATSPASGHSWPPGVQSTLPQLFTQQAEATPDLLAVVCGTRRLTYHELLAESRRIAARLRAQGAGADTLIGLYTERSLETVTGIMGILMAGAAYVPIDPAFPAERVKYVLEDSGVRIVLTQVKLMTVLTEPDVGYEGMLLPLDSEELQWQGGSVETVLPAGEVADAQPSSLAYVIYTSGSTGLPKGVLIEQHSVINLVRHSWLNLYDGRKGLQMGMVASHIFDASVQQLFVALLTGSTLHVLTEEVKGNPVLWTNYLVDHGIQAIDGTPSYLNVMLQAGGPRSRELQLEYMLIGGEALTPAVIESIRQVSAGADFRISNTYGPTETCVDAAYYHVEEENRHVWNELPTIPLGYPSGGARLYILNAQNQPVPIGVAGELCIAGQGVARGYLNRPELTAERFVADPFVPGARMYRSGDLARWLPDGTVEYLGRLDDQIKLNGYRIELGEIESAVRTHPDIADAVVIVHRKASGDRQLAAYYTGEPQPAGTLRGWLRGQLPAYMVPQVYSHLERLPLAPSGKVDRRALPEPQEMSGSRAPQEGAALSALERRIARLWEQELGARVTGRSAHFFELGGHSLTALLLSGRMSRELGVEVSMQKLFEHPTLGAFADWLDEFPAAAASASKPVLTLADAREWYPATSAQQRMFVLHRIGGGDRAYNMPQAFLLTGELDHARLAGSLAELTKRHAILRTTFHLENDELIQRIADTATVELEKLQLAPYPLHGVQETESGVAGGLPDDEEFEGIAELIDAWVRPFELDRLPLMRSGLLQMDDRRHLLLLDLHHIISDGVTMAVLLDELIALYRGEELSLAELQYKDYALWQREWLRSEDYQAQERYWLETLSGELPELELPVDGPRPEVQNPEGGLVSFHTDEQTAEGLRRLAAKSGATLYMVLLAAYKTLLYRYTGHRDLIVGTPVSGRTLPEATAMPGLFVNTLALRSKPDGVETFADYVGQVREVVLAALRHQDYPFEELVDKLHPVRDTGRHPIFDTMFAMDDASFSGGQLTAARELGGLTLAGYPLPFAAAQFDLTVTASEADGGLTFELVYNRSLFRKSTARRLADQLSHLLAEVAAMPEQSLDEIEISPAAERERLLKTFQGEVVPRTATQLLHERFEAQVRLYPDRIAVTDGATQLTYAELDGQAEAAAAQLRQVGVAPEKTVGLLADRSVSMVVGLLAIWKAGGAYVPVSPAYPADYLGHILHDSSVCAVVTEQGYEHLPVAASPAFAGPLIVLENGSQTTVQGNTDAVAESSKEGTGLSAKSVTDRRLAYVLYTSGTTGQPKGVEVEHRSALNLVEHLHRRLYNSASGLCFALSASHVFDASLQQLLTALLTGGTLVVVPDSLHKDPVKLLDVLECKRIDSLDGTPSYLNVILDAAGARRYPGISQLLVGGEPMTGELANRLQATFPSAMIVNAYGPTECTVDAVMNILEPGAKVDAELPVAIGQPIANTEVYVLDEGLRLCPQGAAGELCIGGIGLARGYRNLPALTAQRFVHHPLARGGLLYRTGDRVRWQEDGTLVYLERMDEQIKIRGHRVEPAGIASRLRHLPGVGDAAVIALPGTDGVLELHAYYTAERALDDSLLRSKLEDTLPEHMLPLSFTRLAVLPLTPSGKLDKRALPRPQQFLHTGSGGPAPQTETERRLAAVWRDLLPDVQTIGLRDHFFALGGHSLKAMLLSGKIRRVFGVEVALAELFNHPTLEAQSRLIDGAERVEEVALERASEAPSYPASAAQRRMYVLHQMDKDGTSYSMPQVYELTGELDERRLTVALQALVDRYEVLRTSFHMEGEDVVQQVHDDVHLELEKLETQLGWADLMKSSVVSQAAAAAEQVAAQDATLRGGVLVADRTEQSAQLARYMRSWSEPFLLERAPLLRAGLMELAPDRHLLMLDMHHIISDGVTVQLLFADLAALYTEAQLPAVEWHYKDYALWQRGWLGEDQVAKQERYWLQQLSGEQSPTRLQTDYPRPPMLSTAGDSLSFRLDPALAQQLKRLALAHESSLYMVLLATYQMLLHLYTGQEDLNVGTPVAGRTHPLSGEMPGLFVNTLVLRGRPRSGQPFTRLLQQTKRTALDAFTHQDYPFEELVERLQVGRDPSRNPLFDTMFAMQHAERTNASTDVLQMREATLAQDTSLFDLTLMMMEEGDGGLLGSVEYSTALFHAETAAALARDYVTLLREVVSAPQQTLAGLAEAAGIEMKRAVSMEQASDPVWDANEDRLEEDGEWTPTERLLSKVWADVLEREPQSRNEDFFAIGGHSLKALVLTARLQQHYGLTLALADVFQVPRLHKMAAWLDNTQPEAAAQATELYASGATIEGSSPEAESTADDEGLILLRTGTGEGRQVFLLHDITGEVDGYSHFIRHLHGPDRYWGIRSAASSAEAQDQRDVPAIAAEYVKLIQSKQPQGPYRIAGWSLGGTFGYEVARQLEASGEQVAWLAMFDTMSPEQSLAAASSAAGASLTDYIASELAVLQEDEQWSRYDTEAMMALALAEADYRPQDKLQAQILLCLATDDGGEALDTTLWEPYAKLPLAFCSFEGSHYTIFHPEHSEINASRFTAKLEDIE